jgi:hypothetical protein
MDVDGYVTSLERNVIFLHDLVFEGEALLDLLIKQQVKGGTGRRKLDSILKDMDERIRSEIKRRISEAFDEGRDAEFRELHKLKKADRALFLEKLEVNYRYLMTFRLFLFELFNVLTSIMSQYAVSLVMPSANRRIMNHIELTVNYYLGNIEVGEGRVGKDSEG